MKKKLAIHNQIIIGLILGVIWAFVSSYFGWSEFTINYIGPFGTIFINLLKFIAVPLVLFSVVKGITGLSDIKSLGRLGGKTISFYMVTTVLAVGLGLFLVNFIKPGSFVSEDQLIVNRLSYEMWVEETPGVEYVDHIRYSEDPEYAKYSAEALAKLQEEANNSETKEKIQQANKERQPLDFLVDMVPSNVMKPFYGEKGTPKMLQVIFFAIFLGITIVSIPRSKVETVVNFIGGMDDIFVKMVNIVMAGAPFFVFALLAGKMSELAGDDVGVLLDTLKVLLGYSLVVVLGLFLLILVLYPLIMKLFVKEVSYRQFFKAISPAQFLAFSTSSSAATLPVTMECVNDKLGVKEEVSSFVLPIGATVNMDGTSLYQAVAVIFLAQFHLIDLSFSAQLIIVLTATLASIGSAAVPSAGLIMLIVVLQSVGLNPEWIAIIFPVDRLLDMLRTVVNVTGDATISTVVAKTENKLEFNPANLEGE